MSRILIPVTMVLILLVAIVPGCNMLSEENKPPNAVFGVDPPIINVGETCIFDASASKDKDGKIVKFSWNFGDGTYALGLSTEHTYSEGGDYKVDLVIKDDDGSRDNASTTIHVNEWPSAEGRAGKNPAKVNEIVQFDGSFSSDKDGDIVEYTWDFGDDSSEANGISPTHKFIQTGRFNITLEVKDNYGATATTEFNVQIIKRNFKVLWQENTQVIDTISGHTEENTTTNKTLNVTMTNLTSIEFNLTWSDVIPIVGPANDEFQFEVETPDGDSKVYKTTTEMISFEFRLDELPETLTMEGESIEEVQAFISSSFISTKGNGDWLMRVTCLDAGDWYLDKFNLDTGENWDIEITGTYYTANVIETG